VLNNHSSDFQVARTVLPATPSPISLRAAARNKEDRTP
jgi:hypothetical protein